MPTIIINGYPVANACRSGYLDSYFEPQRKHLRDITEAEDVDYEDIYEQPNDRNDENVKTMAD